MNIEWLFNFILCSSIILLFGGIVILCVSLYMLESKYSKEIFTELQGKIVVDNIKKKERLNLLSKSTMVDTEESFESMFGEEQWRLAYSYTGRDTTLQRKTNNSLRKKCTRIMAYCLVKRIARNNKKVENLNSEITEYNLKLEKCLKIN